MGVQKRNPLVPLDRRCRVVAGELVKENPQLYNTKQNVAARNSRWHRDGEQLVKIMKKEKKNGAGQPQRSVCDNVYSQAAQSERLLPVNVIERLKYL